MASEFLAADKKRLEMLCQLHHLFWTAAPDSKSIVALAGEIRQQERAFGLTPIDRRRLEWQVERGEGAAEQTRKRKAETPPAAPETAAEDPRQGLSVVA